MYASLPNSHKTGKLIIAKLCLENIMGLQSYLKVCINYQHSSMLYGRQKTEK